MEKTSLNIGHRIRFLPDEREAAIEEGKTLLEAAQAAGVYVGAICGGEGTCGKCRLIVRDGEVSGESTEFLTRAEIRRGYVLACQVVPHSDLVVEVPPESRLSSFIGVGKDSDRFRAFERREAERLPGGLDPVTQKTFLELDAPTLDNPTADQERLLEAVAKRQPGPLQMGLKVARELPRLLRRLTVNRSSWHWEWEGQVTATVGMRREVGEVLCLERGDTSQRSFGLALDVGTTTVVAHVVDLLTGATREAAAKYNSQIGFGEDVIGRINYARRPGGAKALHNAVIGDVETLLEDLVRRAQIGRGDIQCVVAAGNTAMLHFLLGLETDLVRIAPFVPTVACPPPVRAAEAGIRIHPRGLLYGLPMVGSYVGGDTTAGILASGMHQRDEIALFLDIGTNGEVVLGNKEFLVACSASAGPAFEGASVACGMRATTGAIDRVRIFRPGPVVSVTTIDEALPVGFCGTGLIETLAEMFLAGIIDRNGRLDPEAAGSRFRLREEDVQPDFVVVSAEEAQHWRDLVITQYDIDNLIRTKGAIFAAADSLVQSLGLSFADIGRVYIAGAFGNRLDVAGCIAIGLLPELPLEQFQFIGNSALTGAKQAILNRRMFDDAHRIRERITYQELMADPQYMERFTSACFLPHTDLAYFPSTAERLQRESGPAVLAYAREGRRNAS